MFSFIRSLQFILRPSFWFMDKPYCPAHDKSMNNLLDKYEFTDIGRFEARLGMYTIWISNYPYMVGIDPLYRYSRPSRLTILRMKRHIEKAIINKYR